jgi:CheY-like chemotaxis protein
MFNMAKILLAEDDLFLRDIYKEVLSDEGFNVTQAIDGQQALKLLKDGSWDLVLLDVVMPKMTGIEVLKHFTKSQVKSLTKHIVFMSNSDEEKELKDVLDMTDGFILKSSYAPDQLVTKIKQYLK